MKAAQIQDAGKTRAKISFAISDELRASLDPITPIFVLIDPMLGDPVPFDPNGGLSDRKAALVAAWQREVEQITLHERVPLASHQHPYLVQLSGIDDSLLDLTLEFAHAERTASMADGLDSEGSATHHIGGWLQSSMHPAQLARHMASMFRVNTDAYTTKTYLRLVDRRVLALLRHVIGNERTIGGFGRLQRWVYLDALGRIAILNSASEDVKPIRLNEAEWAAMELGETLHRTLSQWLGEIKRRERDLPVDLDVVRMFEVVQDALTATQHSTRQWPHRFTSVTDRTIWAALYLLYPQLYRSISVLRLMEQTGSQDEPPEPLRYLHQDISKILNSENELPAVR